MGPGIDRLENKDLVPETAHHGPVVDAQDRAPTKRRGRLSRALDHDTADHEGFGMVAVKCQGYFPDCSYHGFCHHDDECFDSNAPMRAVRRIRSLARCEESLLIYEGMMRAAELLEEELRPPKRAPALPSRGEAR